jgi:hypothetical protein
LCGGDIKDKVFVPHLPASMEELGAWITVAVATVDVDEIAHRWHICHVTRGNYIEQL